MMMMPLNMKVRKGEGEGRETLVGGALSSSGVAGRPAVSGEHRSLPH
jgi:hypothetical protein